MGNERRRRTRRTTTTKEQDTKRERQTKRLHLLSAAPLPAAAAWAAMRTSWPHLPPQQYNTCISSFALPFTTLFIFFHPFVFFFSFFLSFSPFFSCFSFKFGGEQRRLTWHRRGEGRRARCSLPPPAPPAPARRTPRVRPPLSVVHWLSSCLFVLLCFRSSLTAKRRKKIEEEEEEEEEESKIKGG